MIQQATKTLIQNQDLSQEEAMLVMKEIMSGQCSPSQIASYLVALAMKKETVDEVVGSAIGMRARAKQIHPKTEVIEIVGTGGDRSNSFNISTTASLVVASAGIPVAKHGNRAASSRSGAADCLEALGVNLDQDPSQCERLLEEVGICFLFAPNHHPAMKYAAPVRKELGIPTIFNLLGPLTNPANATRQIMGVYSQELVEPMARVLARLGVEKGMVVYGMDGLDEISTSALTYICEIDHERLNTYYFSPEEVGYPLSKKEELLGGDPTENARLTKEILLGNDRGAKRAAVCLNAGAALYIADESKTLFEGIRKAEELIDSKAALHLLDRFVEASYA